MDISECLKILQRHNKLHAEDADGSARSCFAGQGRGCGASDACEGPVPERPQAELPGGDRPPQGQVLDLGTGKNETLQGLGSSLDELLRELPELRELGPEEPAGVEELPQALEGAEAAADAAAALAVRLRPKRSSALAEAVLQQHARRVAAHRAYEACLRRLLTRGRTATALAYPATVAAATARFAAISAQVRAVGAVLAERPGAGPRELAALVGQLQALERRKLALAAASHLDRIRALPPPCGNEPDRGNALAAADAAETRRKLAETDTEIEETVSEIRHALAEVREEEEEQEEDGAGAEAPATAAAKG